MPGGRAGGPSHDLKLDAAIPTPIPAVSPPVRRWAGYGAAGGGRKRWERPADGDLYLPVTGASPALTGASPALTGASPALTGASPALTGARLAARRGGAARPLDMGTPSSRADEVEGSGEEGEIYEGEEEEEEGEEEYDEARDEEEGEEEYEEEYEGEYEEGEEAGEEEGGEEEGDEEEGEWLEDEWIEGACSPLLLT